MVSLMLLSHSRKIAEGVKELAEEVSGGAPVIAVGGTKAARLVPTLTRSLNSWRRRRQRERSSFWPIWAHLY